jgi:hypothetical protein
MSVIDGHAPDERSPAHNPYSSSLFFIVATDDVQRAFADANRLGGRFKARQED